jgi:hypothetical protein
VYNSGDRKRRYQIREYAFWGGPDEGLHNEPSTPFIFHINVPLEYIGYPKGRSTPVIGIGSIYTNAMFAYMVGYDRSYLPPTRLAPFPSLHCSLNYSGWPHGPDIYRPARNVKTDRKYGFSFPAPFGLRRMQARDNCFGYHDRVNTGEDPQKAVVVPYLENRVLASLEKFFYCFPQADRNRVLLKGEGDFFVMGIHHPDVFAAVSIGQFAPWSAKWNERLWMMVGKREWDLKTDRGISVWNWNDPIWYSRNFPKKVWPFIFSCQSPNYAKADNKTHWQNMGYPQFYYELEKDKRGGKWWWCDIGDAPGGKGNLIPLNQAYPAFTNCNFCEKPQMEWRKEPRGTLNGYLTWGPDYGYLRSLRTKKELHEKISKAMVSVDTPGRFEMAVRIGTAGLRLNGQSVPPTNAKFGKTDITLWRLQQFKVESGKTYQWINKKCATGQILQTGSAEPDERGLLTVQGFFVDKDPAGNKLIITPSGTALPGIDKGKEITVNIPKGRGKTESKKLSYVEYVKECEDPVLCVLVKPPSATFKVSDFTLAGKCNADGSRTFTGKGGFGMGSCATTVKILEKGNYMISIRGKATKGAVSWPGIVMRVGGRYGKNMKPIIIDTVEYADYSWYIPLNEGKLDIKIDSLHDYYLGAQLPMKDKGRSFTLADMTIAKIEDSESNKAKAIQISPRGITLAAGLPVNMKAEVLNGLGKPMTVPVSWESSEGGSINNEGIFKASKQGRYTITGRAKGLTGSVNVEVADTMVEDFNEGCGTLRPGWISANTGQHAANWFTPSRGHHMLNSLWAQPPRVHGKTPDVKSLLLWDHGKLWKDYEVQADVIVCPSARTPEPGVRGLVFRAQDKDNHLRLEIDRTADGAGARIIKRQKGEETKIAEAKAPAYAPFDYKTNPMCPGWHSWDEIQGKKLKSWKLDRLRVQVKGDTVRAWVNGQELFSGGVKNADPARGSIGLYARTLSCFDNVRVKPLD